MRDEGVIRLRMTGAVFTDVAVGERGVGLGSADVAVDVRRAEVGVGRPA